MTTPTPAEHGIRRRPWLLEPGTPLIGEHDPVDNVLVFEELLRLTGLAIDPADDEIGYDVISSPAGPFPLIINWPPEVDAPDDNLASLNPETAWHPMFWLPASIRYPLVTERADGQLEIEDPLHWHFRASISISDAGIYEESTGEWLDPLATFLGLDIDDPEVQQRVKAHLAGGDDPELATIPSTLAALVDAVGDDIGNPDWAADATRTHAADRIEFTQFVFAHVLRQHIETRGAQFGAFEHVDHAALAIANIAMMTLDGLEAKIDLDGGERLDLADYLDRVRQLAQADGNGEQVLAALDGALAQLCALGEVRFPEPDDEAPSDGPRLAIVE